KFNREDKCIEYLNNFKLTPSEANNNLCEEFNADLIREPLSAAEFIRHKNVSLELINKLINNLNLDLLNNDEKFYVETELKYAGYIEKEERTAAKMAGLDNALIPDDFDYSNIKSLSAESRQKLIKFKPRSLGQALRISGVTPTDVQLLSVLIKAKN
ncbi:MAG: tRNA uridine-5-carboxymethylaminomethyl(34) synthesis enzyme MnmG, partial [Synergistaceae bacterium]|nr:tRNA uridine-5-carboxymethylaminomethyl(34) synthesis enzyme MnmG [Synergistaceae bacterium]